MEYASYDVVHARNFRERKCEGLAYMIGCVAENGNGRWRDVNQALFFYHVSLSCHLGKVGLGAQKGKLTKGLAEADKIGVGAVCG